MAENKKQSLIEEALNEVNQFKEAMKNNTKEILRSIAKEEIAGLVNESLGEDLDNDEDEYSDDAEVGGGLDVDTPSDDAEEIGVDAEAGAGEEVEFEADTEDAISVADDLGSEEGSSDYEGEEGTDMEYDFTNSSDEDVIAVFKKLSADDEIEIIDDNEVHIKDPASGSEYHVKLGGGNAEAPGMDADAVDAPMAGLEDEMEAPEMGAEMDTDISADTDAIGGEEEDEFEYEVELGDDEEEEVAVEGVHEDIVRGKGHDTYVTDASLPTGDMEGQKAEKDSDTGDNLTGGFDDDAVSHANAEGDMVMNEEDEVIEEDEEDVIEEEELDEAIPVGNAQGRRVPGKNTPIKGAGAKSLSETDYKTLKEGYAKIVKENNEFKSALKQFRNMLSEVGVFNSNLTYATKIFTEHSTTQEEKKNILKRFDNEATTIKESKKVYKSVLEGFNKKPVMQESVGNKLSAEAKTSSQSRINESTSYEDASTIRMKELMKKVERR